MGEDAKLKKPRAPRGTGFPVVSLPEATRIIREAGAYGKRHTESAFAAYAGHKTANSGAWKAKLAALRDWGLVVAVPPGSFELTDRAMQIAHPATNEDAQIAQYQAFIQCQVFMSLYEALGKGLELKTAQIANKAVTDFQVAVSSKDHFARSFIESAVAVGLAEQISEESVRLNAPRHGDAGGSNGQVADAESAELNLGTAGRTVRRTPKDIDELIPAIQQVWPVEFGEISFSINTSHPLDGRVFVEVANVIAAIEKVAQLMRPTIQEAEEGED